MSGLEQIYAARLAKRETVSWDGIKKSDLLAALKACGVVVHNTIADADPRVVEKIVGWKNAGMINSADIYLQISKMRDVKTPPGPFNLDPIVKGSVSWTISKNKVEFDREGRNIPVSCSRGIAVLNGDEMAGAPKVRVLAALLCADIVTFTTITNEKAVVHFEADVGPLNRQYDQSAAADHFKGMLNDVLTEHPFKGSLSGFDMAEKMYQIHAPLKPSVIAQTYYDGMRYEPEPVRVRSVMKDVPFGDVIVPVRTAVKFPPIPEVVTVIHGTDMDDALCQVFCGQMTKATGLGRGYGAMTSMFVDGVPLTQQLRSKVNDWTYFRNIDFNVVREIAVDMPSTDVLIWLWKQANMLHPKHKIPLIFYKIGNVTSTAEYVEKVRTEGGVMMVSSFEGFTCLHVDMSLIDVQANGVLATVRKNVEDQVDGRWWFKKKFMARVPIMGLKRLITKFGDIPIFMSVSVEASRGYVVVSNVAMMRELSREDLVKTCKMMAYIRHRYRYFHVTWEELISSSKSYNFPSLVVGQLYNVGITDCTELLEIGGGITITNDLVLSENDLEDQFIARGRKDILVVAEPKVREAVAPVQDVRASAVDSSMDSSETMNTMDVSAMFGGADMV